MEVEVASNMAGGEGLKIILRTVSAETTAEGSAAGDLDVGSAAGMVEIRRC